MDTFEPRLHALETLAMHTSTICWVFIPLVWSGHLAAIRFLATHFPMQMLFRLGLEPEYDRAHWMRSVDMSKHKNSINFFSIVARTLRHCSDSVTLRNFRNGNGHRHKAWNDHNKEMDADINIQRICRKHYRYDIWLIVMVQLKLTWIRPSWTENELSLAK